MYTFVLALHNWMRWLVVIALAWATFRAFTGWRGGRPWLPADRTAGRWLAIGIDSQLVVGLLLYAALSPITRQAMGDMGAAMADATLRFFAVEHAFGALVAVAVVHGAQVMARKADSDVGRHRRLAIGYALIVLILVVSVPWPWMAAARPLFRMPF